MKYKDLAFKILEKAEKEHLNLYHDISKQEVLEFIDSIDWNNINDTSFDKQMLKLFALFKDAHTLYWGKWEYLDNNPIYIEDKLYILHNGKYREIKKIGSISSEEFIKEISTMCCYETVEYLKDTIRSVIKNGYYYRMLGLEENKTIVLTLENGEKCCINLISKTEAIEKGNLQALPNYEFKVIDENVLYFIYRKCMQHKDYTFSTFMEELKQEIKSKNITKYILDLRGNHGGDSEILNPFQDLVKEQNLKGVLLIDNGTFSSGRFAVSRFKNEFNTPLIGEGTGGASKSYGFNKNLEVEGKKFCVSTHLWDFSWIFGYTGSIQPDIYVEKTLKDIETKEDSQLNTAIEIIKKEEKTID